MRLAGYVGELNANKDLYDKLCDSLDQYDRISAGSQASTRSGANPTGESLEGYTREALHVGKLLKRDFDKAGISLGNRDRQHIVGLQSLIYSTGSQISRPFRSVWQLPCSAFKI